MNYKSGVTVVLTSCRRADLLEQTLNSFFQYNDHPVARVLVVEDGDDPAVPALVREKFADRVELIVNSPRIGQIRSIDRAYSMVDTELVFHCEDDWHFFRRGFMQESIDVLRERPDVHQVILRDLWDTNGHPPSRERYHTTTGVPFRLMTTGFRTAHHVWHGFSFNPGLRRMREYAAIGPYSKLGHESEIGQAYFDRGLRAAILEESAVEHIGWGRHIVDVRERREGHPLRRALKMLTPPIIPWAVRKLVPASSSNESTGT